jgi:hypothetical protein
MKLFTAMYCPRCGYEGAPTIRGLTYGLVGSPFLLASALGFIAIGCFILLLTIAAWWAFLITVPLGMFCLVISEWLLGVCCPQCRYIWVTSRDEYRRKLKELNYFPPHLLNRKDVYKDGKIIPWR